MFHFQAEQESESSSIRGIMEMKNPADHANLTIVTLSSVSSQFVAGLIWSGLPHYAAVSTGHNALYGLLFAVTSIAGIFTPFIGGLIPKRFGNALVAIVSSITTAICYLMIVNIDLKTHSLTIAIILLIGSVCAALSGPAFSDMLGQVQKKAYSGDLESGSGHY